MRPIFQKNHPSWEEDAYAREALLSVIAQWFNAGSIEYVVCLHRPLTAFWPLALCPKKTHPLRGPTTDRDQSSNTRNGGGRVTLRYRRFA